jgi:23S rRNA pseudouridine2604 synthase
MNDDIIYPVRVNRYLFLKGYCSRRQADKHIEKGQVQINGKVAVLGQKVNEKDEVEIASSIKKLPESYQYFIFNKPIGIVSHNPQKGEEGVENIFTKKVKLSPVGRLDKASEGLMLLTNDGRIVDKLLNPKFDHEKEYKVYVNKELKPSFENKMSKGVDIEGYITKPARTRIMGKKSFRITLTEGKKHQIRRMCAALGYDVRKLKRIRMSNLRLGSLPVGKGRELNVGEKMELLGNLK